MNSDKSLTRTVETTLYQGERLVDKIKFLLPQTYDGLDLSQFEVYLTYVDGGNVLHSEQLELSDPNYKGSMLCYCVPVGCCLTRFAGDVEVHLTLSKSKKQIMHSGDTNIYITPTDPWYQKIVDANDCTCGESGDNSGAEGDGSGDGSGGAEDDSQLEALIETDMLPAVHNADGKILTDENGKIILRY